jgi:hypothetical protein
MLDLSNVVVVTFRQAESGNELESVNINGLRVNTPGDAWIQGGHEQCKRAVRLEGHVVIPEKLISPAVFA